MLYRLVDRASVHLADYHGQLSALREEPVYWRKFTAAYSMKMKIVYSVWQQCMLDSHNYNKIQTQIRQ